MADGLTIRARGLQNAINGLRATERQLQRAARNAGRQVATATRKRAVDKIAGGTALKKSRIRKGIGLYRTKPAEFERDGVAAIMTPRGARRYPIKITEYKPKPVSPGATRYSPNRTRRDVLIKDFVDEPPRRLSDPYFMNPVASKTRVYRRVSSGEAAVVGTWTALHRRVDRIMPGLSQYSITEYRRRFADALRKQLARSRR